MKRGNVFWGLILILLGILFYLKTTGLINDVFGWFWPFALILLGVWFLLWKRLPTAPGSSEDGEELAIELQGAARLDLEVEQGAGSLSISTGTPAGLALTGTQAAGLDVKNHREGDSLVIKLEAGPTFLPFLGPEGGEWRFYLTRELPVSIKLSAGASSLNLDLTEARLSFLGVDTGASNLSLKLPANAGQSLVQVESGAASLDLSVPEGVGLRLRFDQGASSIDIDEKRFPRLTHLEGIYQSSDYDSATNKVEINLDGGANSVKVH